MIVNNHGPDSSYHFSSADGIHDWKYRGLAFRKGGNTFRYTDGTVNNWGTVQRMTAYVENGHVTHFLFSVIDVHKGYDNGNDNHGSKIMVVPFDGEAFDKWMKSIVKQGK